MPTALATELLPEVAELLTESPVPGLIGGEDALAGNGAVFTTRDPGSGQPLAEVTAMQAADVDRAVQAAQRAFDTNGWRQMSPNERGVLLHRLADAVERHKDVADSNRGPRHGQDPRPGRVGSAGFRRHACATTPTWRCTSSAAARWPSRATRSGFAAAVGAVRVHLPLELPGAPDGLEPFAGLGRREHGDRQAAGGRPVGRDLPGPARPRGRHSRRRVQRRAGLRRSGRRGIGLAPRHSADVVHRLARDRPADCRRVRAKPRAGEAGARRQGRGGGVRRRRSDARGRAVGPGDLLPRGPSLLRPDALAGPPLDL